MPNPAVDSAPAMKMPENAQEAIDLLASMDATVEINSSLSYWNMGRILNHMKGTLGIEHPSVVVSQTIQQSERLLRYCQSVHAAYEWATLRRLVERGKLRWTLIRDLASPKFSLPEGNPLRDKLIALFEEGSYTAVDLALQVKRMLAGGEPTATDGGTDEDIACKFKHMVESVRLLASKLEKAASPAVEEFKGGGRGLADALIADDGGVDKAAEELVLGMCEALQKAIFVASDLLYRANLAVVVQDWPFEELDAMLDKYHENYTEDGKLIGAAKPVAAPAAKARAVVEV